MPNYLKTDSLSALQSLINSKQPVILKIGHNGCAPCIRIAPVIEKVAKKVPEITFIDYDISFMRSRSLTPEEDYFIRNLKFRSVPHFVMYYNGIIYNHNSPNIYRSIQTENIDELMSMLPKNKIQGEGIE